jgi:Fur family transcriptional regulator, peroxide stress response regulator
MSTMITTEERYEQRRIVLLTRLSTAGHRMTPQRLAIVDSLLKPNRHPTADDIYEEVLCVSPTTSRATVYKTVETLKALGELRELDLGIGRAHYDAANPTDHPHVVCRRCGRIEDVEIGGFSDLIEEARTASGFTLDSERLEFFGLCPECKPLDSKL